MGPGSHVGFPISAKNKNLVYDHPMNISAKFGSNHGGHLEFPIGKRFISLVQDHPMIIPAKSQFNFCGFRKKDENVKFP